MWTFSSMMENPDKHWWFWVVLCYESSYLEHISPGVCTFYRGKSEVCLQLSLVLCWLPLYDSPLIIHWRDVLFMDTSKLPFVPVKGEEGWLIVIWSFKSQEIHESCRCIGKSNIPQVLPKSHTSRQSRSSNSNWNLLPNHLLYFRMGYVIHKHV